MSKLSAVEIKRYKTGRGRLTRYWAVYIEGELLAVVLYRKGALAIMERIQAAHTKQTF